MLLFAWLICTAGIAAAAKNNILSLPSGPPAPFSQQGGSATRTDETTVAVFTTGFGPNGGNTAVSKTSAGAAETSTIVIGSTTSTPSGTSLNPTDGSSAGAAGSSSGAVESDKTALSSDAKIGIGVGVGVSVVALLAGMVWFFLFRRRRRSLRQMQNGGYSQANSTEQFGKEKDAAIPIITNTALAPPPREPSPRAGSRSVSRPQSQLSHSSPPTQTPLLSPNAITPSGSTSSRRSFERQRAAGGHRPPQPSIFTEVFSPVSEREEDEPVSPVSPVSPISENGSRPASLRRAPT